MKLTSTSAFLRDDLQVPTKYGGTYTVTLIPGDGIGAEVADSVKEIFTSLNVPVEWEQYNVSGETHGDEAEFKRAMESLKRNKVGLKGILYTPIDGHNSWNVAMRQSLDIYANVVVCKTMDGVPTRHDGVDFAIIRENTEGEYAGLEHQSYPGVVENLKVMTRVKAERIARFAFDYALKNGRKKVTCVHKANIMKVRSRRKGLWLGRAHVLIRVCHIDAPCSSETVSSSTPVPRLPRSTLPAESLSTR